MWMTIYCISVSNSINVPLRHAYVCFYTFQQAKFFNNQALHAGVQGFATGSYHSRIILYFCQYLDRTVLSCLLENHLSQVPKHTLPVRFSLLWGMRGWTELLPKNPKYPLVGNKLPDLFFQPLIRKRGSFIEKRKVKGKWKYSL